MPPAHHCSWVMRSTSTGATGQPYTSGALVSLRYYVNGDISSVATDFLATTRPVIVTNPQGLPLDDFHAAYPSQRGCYVIGPELATLTAAMTDALGPDPLRPERLAMRAHVLGDLPAGPQAAFDEALARLSGRAVG